MPACRARGKRANRRAIRRHRRARRDTSPSGQIWVRLGGPGQVTCLLDARPAAIAGKQSGILPGKPWKLLPRTGSAPLAAVFAHETVRHSERSSAGLGSDPNLTRTRFQLDRQTLRLFAYYKSAPRKLKKSTFQASERRLFQLQAALVQTKGFRASLHLATAWVEQSGTAESFRNGCQAEVLRVLANEQKRRANPVNATSFTQRRQRYAGAPLLSPS